MEPGIIYVRYTVRCAKCKKILDGYETMLSIAIVLREKGWDTDPGRNWKWICPKCVAEQKAWDKDTLEWLEKLKIK